MDVQKKLDEIVDAVGSARSMPMSASCVINRAELLARLEELRSALPGSLAQAEEVLGGRARMVREAQEEAERIIESAHAQRGSLISDTEVARQSQEEADRILAEARQEAEEIRAEADDYVDSKLANFEVVLTKTIGSVDRGREKLLGRAPAADPFGAGAGDGTGNPEEEPERSADPETLRQRADEYVDTKLGAVAAVLSKTLEAVGRGRQKLLGARAIDELGAHMAAQDAAGFTHTTSDDDFLADLARSQEAPVARGGVPARQPAPAAAEYYDPAAAGYPQSPPEQDPYGGYGQQGYPGQDQGVPLQHDPYAARNGYQQDVYGGWQQPQYDGGGYPADPQGQHGQQQGQHAQQQPQVPQQPPYQPGAALEETSLFDTSMIDLEQLRQYEQGR